MTREGPPLAGTESAGGFDCYSCSWRSSDDEACVPPIRGAKPHGSTTGECREDRHFYPVSRG